MQEFKTVLTPFTLVIYLIWKSLKSFVVSKLVCSSCKACYICKTTCQLTTRINEHLERTKKSRIFTHLFHNENCKGGSWGKGRDVVYFGFIALEVVSTLLTVHFLQQNLLMYRQHVSFPPHFLFLLLIKFFIRFALLFV